MCEKAIVSIKPQIGNHVAVRKGISESSNSQSFFSELFTGNSFTRTGAENNMSDGIQFFFLNYFVATKLKRKG